MQNSTPFWSETLRVARLKRDFSSIGGLSPRQITSVAEQEGLGSLSWTSLLINSERSWGAQSGACPIYDPAKNDSAKLAQIGFAIRNGSCGGLVYVFNL